MHQGDSSLQVRFRVTSSRFLYREIKRPGDYRISQIIIFATVVNLDFHFADLIQVPMHQGYLRQTVHTGGLADLLQSLSYVFQLMMPFLQG